MQYVARDRLGRRIRDDVAGEHLSLVAHEIRERSGERVLGRAELGSEGPRLKPVRLAFGVAQTSHHELVETQRGHHERHLHPHDESRIVRAVRTRAGRGAAHSDGAPIDASKGGACLRGRPEHDRERRVEGPQQPSERVAAEVRMLVDAGGHQRVGDLKEKRRGAAEEQKRLAVQAARDGISRQDAEVGHTPSVALIRSFAYALSGLHYLVSTERNFQIEVAAAALAVIAGAWLGLERVEWIALAVTIALVLILEALNTAIEDAVSLASPAFDERARTAKDVSAAAVLFAAVLSIVVGVLLFGPRLVRIG